MTRAVRPHHHHPESFDRLRTGVTKAFTATGAPPELAEQSWYVLGTCLVSRLAGYEAPLGLGAAEPRFGLFLDALRARPAGTRTSRGPARARAAGVACPDPRTTMDSAHEGGPKEHEGTEGNSVIDELTAFVRARMTEDLAYAWGSAVAGGQWTADGPRLVADSGAAFELAAPLAAHAAHHDPARVVRAVAAKQAIVARCERHLAQGGSGSDARDSELFVAQILVALAADWVSHPDYRDEWNGSPAGET